MTELKKIKYTKIFIDKLANGINPIIDTAVKDDDVVNNVRVTRCFFYISDILRQIIENGGISKKKNEKIPFYLTAEQLSKFKFSETPIPHMLYLYFFKQQVITTCKIHPHNEPADEFCLGQRGRFTLYYRLCFLFFCELQPEE